MRAWASAPSFRGEASLEECREQAALHVKAVFADADNPELTEAQKCAREAGALDYQRRVDEALATVGKLRDEGRKKPRASTTDAEARVMKMPDGGFRPAYNIQQATAGSPMGGPRTVVGVLVTNRGSDMRSITAMLDQIESRTKQRPEVLLADANHATHDCIRNATQRGVTPIVAVPSRSEKPGPQGDTDPDVQAWRDRMQTDEARKLYKARAALCELTNAHLKSHHGMSQVLVRGVGKVRCVALLGALTANLLAHAHSLLA